MLIVDKEEFKRLKQEGGGIRGVKCNIVATYEHGFDSIKFGAIGNLAVMNNGIFFDILMSSKFFIPAVNIDSIESNNQKLSIVTTDKSENKNSITFRINSQRDLSKICNVIEETIGVNYTSIDAPPSKSIRQIEKENKQKEFERIMASNPEVTVSTTVNKSSFISEKRKEKELEEERVAKMKKEGVVFCPKCHSTSITAQKRGFGVGKAALGVFAVGGYGLVAGGINSKKIDVTCLNCGYSWKAGKK